MVLLTSLSLLYDNFIFFAAVNRRWIHSVWSAARFEYVAGIDRLLIPMICHFAGGGRIGTNLFNNREWLPESQQFLGLGRTRMHYDKKFLPCSRRASTLCKVFVAPQSVGLEVRHMRWTGKCVSTSSIFD
jgi:hypothetical protein